MRTRAELITRLDALNEQAMAMYNALLSMPLEYGGHTVARWGDALDEIDNAAACVTEAHAAEILRKRGES